MVAVKIFRKSKFVPYAGLTKSRQLYCTKIPGSQDVGRKSVCVFFLFLQVTIFIKSNTTTTTKVHSLTTNFQPPEVNNNNNGRAGGKGNNHKNNNNNHVRRDIVTQLSIPGPAVVVTADIGADNMTYHHDPDGCGDGGGGCDSDSNAVSGLKFKSAQPLRLRVNSRSVSQDDGDMALVDC